MSDETGVVAAAQSYADHLAHTAADNPVPHAVVQAVVDEAKRRLTLYTDEQNAHKLTAETLASNVRERDRMERYRVERDKLRRLAGALHDEDRAMLYLFAETLPAWGVHESHVARCRSLARRISAILDELKL